MSDTSKLTERGINQTPLLSICIPTYNKSEFLGVMLQALLPQVAECGDLVEVWVLDNASTDETSSVVEQSRALGKLNYVRNDENLGPTRNIVKGPAELARGRYSWVIGHHSLLVPDSLARVVRELQTSPEIEFFYVNFRCAVYPDHWPKESNGGFFGQYDYLGNPETADQLVASWSHLIRPESAFCTQMYAHIVSTCVWRDYWCQKSISGDYMDAVTTYPHTAMLVDVAYNKPAKYLGLPVLTIFNGAQSWGDPRTQCAVYLNGLSNLINRIGARGNELRKTQEWKRGFCTTQTAIVLARAIREIGIVGILKRIVASVPMEAYVWRAFWLGFLSSEVNWASRSLAGLNRWFGSRNCWWIFNCRPARWVRRLLN